MAFLRILPEANLMAASGRLLNLIQNSPATRSYLLQRDFKTRLFVSGLWDVAALRKLGLFSERFVDLGKSLATYHRHMNEGNFAGVVSDGAKVGEMIEQIYTQEIENWHRKEKFVEVLTEGSVHVGFTAVELSSKLLMQNIPREWEWAISYLLKLLSGLAKKRLLDQIRNDKIVDWLWNTKTWPLYEKGIPYLVWKSEVLSK